MNLFTQAVDIVALLRSTKEGANEPLSTILIEQYRPPTSRITIGTRKKCLGGGLSEHCAHRVHLLVVYNMLPLRITEFPAGAFHETIN